MMHICKIWYLKKKEKRKKKNNLKHKNVFKGVGFDASIASFASALSFSVVERFMWKKLLFLVCLFTIPYWYFAFPQCLLRFRLSVFFCMVSPPFLAHIFLYFCLNLLRCYLSLFISVLLFEWVLFRFGC